MALVFPSGMLDKVVDASSQLALDRCTLYGTLRACSLASRVLRPRSQYNIFKHAILETRSQLDLFLQILEEKPHLAALVVELVLSPSNTDSRWPLATIMASLMDKMLPKLRSITLHDVHLSTYPSRLMSQIFRFPIPSTLRISRSTFQNAWDLRHLVGRASTLETLELFSLDFILAPTEEDGIRAGQLSHPVLPNLKKLQITKVRLKNDITRYYYRP